MALKGESRRSRKCLKAKLRREKSELVSATTQLKLTAADAMSHAENAENAEVVK